VDDLRRAFGARIRALRRGRDSSQEELAGRAGIHWSYLSDLERGEQSPSLDVVNRLARGLRVTLAELFQPLDGNFRAHARKRRSQ
jgi:transcriptional regulator with XRE-family HTH domain